MPNTQSPRPQLPERKLRLSGYQIFMDEWARTSPEARAEFVERIRTMQYQRFLKTEYWHIVRVQVWRIHKGQCRGCGKRSLRMDVHHDTYEHHGSEHLHLTDLMLLCKVCHEHRQIQQMPETLEHMRRRRPLPTIPHISAGLDLEKLLAQIEGEPDAKNPTA